MNCPNCGFDGEFEFRILDDNLGTYPSSNGEYEDRYMVSLTTIVCPSCSHIWQIEEEWTDRVYYD